MNNGNNGPKLESAEAMISPPVGSLPESSDFFKSESKEPDSYFPFGDYPSDLNSSSKNGNVFHLNIEDGEKKTKKVCTDQNFAFSLERICRTSPQFFRRCPATSSPTTPSSRATSRTRRSPAPSRTIQCRSPIRFRSTQLKSLRKIVNFNILGSLLAFLCLLMLFLVGRSLFVPFSRLYCNNELSFAQSSRHKLCVGGA